LPPDFRIFFTLSVKPAILILVSPTSLPKVLEVIHAMFIPARNRFFPLITAPSPLMESCTACGGVATVNQTEQQRVSEMTFSNELSMISPWILHKTGLIGR
jgi:hypothetical protein